MSPARLLANPVMAVLLRVLVGAYIVYMARRFYVDPLGYFRRSLHSPLQDVPWLPRVVRAAACFCLWGGCFIVATAIAVQVFKLHGDTLALALIALTIVAAWLLLPSRSPAS